MTRNCCREHNYRKGILLPLLGLSRVPENPKTRRVLSIPDSTRTRVSRKNPNPNKPETRSQNPRVPAGTKISRFLLIMRKNCISGVEKSQTLPKFSKIRNPFYNILNIFSNCKILSKILFNFLLKLSTKT